MLRAALIPLLTLAACGDGGGLSGEPVRVAMLAPATGPLQGVGESFLRVARVAVASINDLGGIDGRELVLIEEDTMADPALAEGTLDRLIRDEGIVAAVGPATSGEVAAAYGVARQYQVPIISPSSTAPFLSEVNDDDGYMFRNVPDDDIQGVAIAYYLHTLKGVTSAAALYEDTGYGLGLKDAFKDAFIALGGTVTAEVAFAQGFDATGAEAAIAELAAGPAPSVVVTVALEQDAVALTQAWDDGGDPVIPGMQFFMTDGARSQGFLDGAPDSVVGMCGSAPTYPVRGDAYDVLKDAYEEDNDDVLEAQVYAPNVWDAFHLIAAGLVQQSNAFPGEALGGANLRDAITAVSRDGQILHSGEWRNIISNLRAGNDIDYDGAAGPNNFDDAGQAVGPYEVWCVGPDRSSFTQELFLGTRALEDLQDQ